MRRILAAVDASPISADVIREAALIAKTDDAVISVVHVLSEDEASEMLEVHAHQPQEHPYDWTQPEDRANEVAQNAAEGLNEYGVRYDTFGYIGNPLHKILSEAKEQQADMIVIGFHGLHGLGKVKALGSVSRAVIENAHCPVLIVPAIDEIPLTAEMAQEARLRIIGV